jgi:hypothetical protein
MMRASTPLLLALWNLSAVAPAVGQDTTCTYDRCALGVHHGPWRSGIVRGSQRAMIARVGLLAPPLTLLASRTDSAGTHYRAFRAAYNTGFWFQLVGAVSLVASTVVVQADGDDVLVGATFFVALGFGIWGSERRRHARNELDQAIWWYNRSLTR